MGAPSAADRKEGAAEPRAQDHRRAATDDKVFRATLDILRGQGVAAVTVEAVAIRSGVAKTTIYRRYADRREMLRATLDHYLPAPTVLLPALTVVDSGDPQRALAGAVRMMSTAIERYIGTAFAAVLDDRRGPTAALVRERVIQPRVDAMTTFLRACLSAGYLRQDIDENIVIDMIIGSVGVHYARFGTFDEDWPERFVAHLWPAIAALPEPGAVPGSP